MAYEFRLVRQVEFSETDMAGIVHYSNFFRYMEAAEHALRLQPADARYRRALARIEARACIAQFRTEACRERVHVAYAQAERLSRYDPTIPLELAMFLLELGDAQGARRAAERALKLEPEAVLPRLVLADALIKSDPVTGLRRAGDLLREADH